jgi:predicted MFS family arabinose efflux permease
VKLSEATGWRRPEILLIVMAAGVPLSFSTWNALLNNFGVELASFTGADIGLVHTVREIPGFISLGVVFVLWLMREQTLALLALAILGIGTAVTGLFPSLLGICITGFVMSMGFHYFEAVRNSLTLQWVDKKNTPEVLGKLIAIGSFASIASYALVWVAFEFLQLGYVATFAIGGIMTCAMVVFAVVSFPRFESEVEQHRHLVLRKRYWLYYLLTFMSGARRQIFMVFAAFLLVEKFGYSVQNIALLYLLNSALNIWFAPKIGRLIGRIGERSALVFEYAGLILVFTAYAFVEVGWMAAGLYIVDHLFFALAIAIKTYFQKIADPADIAATSGVSFTINHIAAVVIPVSFGVIWLWSPAAVFLAGATMAAISLILSLNVPRNPGIGNEVVTPKPQAESLHPATPNR